MNDNANTAPVVYVLRVLDFDLLADQSREDLGEEILSSHSVYRSAAGALLAVVKDIKTESQDRVNNGEEPLYPSKIVWHETTYKDYADVERKEWVCKVEETSTIYRVIEVELHD